MGLTIHYDLHATELETLADAKNRLAQLHRFARKLPIKECTKLMTWVSGKDDPQLSALFSYILPLGDPNDENRPHHFVEPLELAFFGLMQPGSETAWFGLARYPLTMTIPERGIKNCRTGLTGWRWRAFPKTQYASMPKEGGWDNFFAIHDSICRTLDEAVRLKMRPKVLDEGNYWQDRDPKKLHATVDKWSYMIAAFVGDMKDRLGNRRVVAPITEDPTFEHMEAKGRMLFDDMNDSER